MFRPPRGSFSLEPDEEEVFNLDNPMPFFVQPVEAVPTEEELRLPGLPPDWQTNMNSVLDTITFSLLISGWVPVPDPADDDHLVWFRATATLDLFLTRLDIYLESSTTIWRYRAENDYWRDGVPISEDAFGAALVL